jgi:dihydroneopterin aldolase
MDRIELRGLRALGAHGALPEEQGRAQPFEVDLDVELDLGPAGRSDDLADTVDYGSIVGVVNGIVTGAHAALLEHLAQRIAEGVLADGRVTAVSVTVRKLRPPVPADLDHVAVTIRRGR